MQFIRGLFLVAMLCVALVCADKAQVEEQPRQQRNPKRHLVGNTEADNTSGGTHATGKQGFGVDKVNFLEDNNQEDEKGKTQSSLKTIPIIAAVGACACIGLLGAVYMKRRKDNDKLAGEIFTIDDKNSVL